MWNWFKKNVHIYERNAGIYTAYTYIIIYIYIYTHTYIKCSEKDFPPSCFLYFFAYFSHLKDSDHQTIFILHKVNAL